MSFVARTKKWFRYAKQHPWQAVGMLIVGIIPIAILHLLQRQVEVWEDDFLDNHGTTLATYAFTGVVDFLARHPVWSILLFALTVVLGLIAHAYISTHPFNEFEKDQEPDLNHGTPPPRSPSAATPLPPTTSSPEPEPTLLSLMDTGFPTLNKLWAKPVLSFKDGSSLQIMGAQYFDLFVSGGKFIGFYIPSSPHLMEACELLATDPAKWVTSGLIVVCRAPGENPQTANDLRYSGKVYLYHEDVLTHKQMGEIEDIFNRHQQNAVLRGPDFLATAWIDWKRKQPSATIPATGGQTGPTTQPALGPEIVLAADWPSGLLSPTNRRPVSVLEDSHQRPFGVSNQSTTYTAYNVQIRSIERNGKLVTFSPIDFVGKGETKQSIPAVAGEDYYRATSLMPIFEADVSRRQRAGEMTQDSEESLTLITEYDDMYGGKWETEQELIFNLWHGTARLRLVYYGRRRSSEEIPLNQSDPHIRIEIVSEQIKKAPYWKTRFVLYNEGGSTAYRVKVADIDLGSPKTGRAIAKFEIVEAVAVSNSATVVPEIDTELTLFMNAMLPFLKWESQTADKPELVKPITVVCEDAMETFVVETTAEMVFTPIKRETSAEAADDFYEVAGQFHRRNALEVEIQREQRPALSPITVRNQHIHKLRRHRKSA